MRAYYHKDQRKLFKKKNNLYATVNLINYYRLSKSGCNKFGYV